MKKFLLAGCGVWLIATVAIAQKNVSENTLLWEVSGNGLKQPSYLFGTMHLMCAADTRLSDNLKKIIKETDEIYFEIDMDNFAEMLGAMKYLKMNDNKKLSDFLSDEEYSKVKDYFQKNPGMLPLDMMQYFKPYFISSLISEKAMACANEGGMEQTIMEDSKQYHKEIKGLETVAFQASVFDSIPYELQAKELVKYLDSVDQNNENTKELIAVYKSQDLKKIQELTEKEEGGVSQFMDILLYNRNADWVKKMGNIIPDKKVLFAVGAAHLPGEKGLISLLRKKGYTLKPMDNKPSAAGISL
jgi:uncharacterized protein YbaP (TraB family)